MAVFKTAGSYT